MRLKPAGGYAGFFLAVLLGLMTTQAAHGTSLKAVAGRLPYQIVDTGQDRCFSDSSEIPYPSPGAAFHGQDAQYAGNQPAYRDNGDGTVTDLVTGLMWQKTPDLKNKATFAEALSGARLCRLAGHEDWRLPNIKELYSLIDFRGHTRRQAARSVPYLDTKYFDFAFGDTGRGERVIDAQYWSATEYLGLTMRGNPTVFGVNFADGRIKGYPRDRGRRGGPAKRFVRYVRGNPRYGINQFVDNRDGTISDRATGLMWMKSDSGRPMDWHDALAYSEGLVMAGYDDWRLPNAKELQSIVDYSRAPDARQAAARGAAMDPIFGLTETESFFWTSTTHLENRSCGFAVYVCFGRGFGRMHGIRMNVHGAGAQRSDPKAGNPADWKSGNGPQGDEVRIYNYVRCVRGGRADKRQSGPPVEGTFFRGRRSPGQRPGFVSRLDADGDGKVSRSEFDGPPRHFDVLDRDRDGYLSEDEAPQGPPRRGLRPPRF